MTEDLKKVAQRFFISGDFSNALKIYKQLEMPLEMAYCELFLGHLDRAKKIVSEFMQNSPAEEWLTSFIKMIEAELKHPPSYLQIRNFLEIDLNNLFMTGEKKWIENVINYVPMLASVNPEVYKLSARVLKNNGQNELAKIFLKKSLDICFYDSETHFMLAQIYVDENKLGTAKQHLNYARENEEYMPAKKMLEILSKFE